MITAAVLSSSDLVSDKPEIKNEIVCDQNISSSSQIGELLKNRDSYNFWNNTVQVFAKIDLKSSQREKILRQLEDLIRDDEHFFSNENLELPNDLALDNSLNILTALYGESISPSKLSTSVEGGFCFSFIKRNETLYLEVYNDGEQGVIVENREERNILSNIDFSSNEEVVKYILDYYIMKNAVSQVSSY